jgi:hypothetical protein
MATSSWILGTISGVWVSGVLASTDTGTVSPPPCPPDAFETVMPADTGWRARIQAQVASVRADTLLEAAVGYRDSVTAADRAVLQGAGAVLTYEFAGMPAVSIRLSAGGLARLTASGGPLPDSRVVFVELGRRYCVAGTRLETLKPSA